MPSMLTSSDDLHSMEIGLFNQIAVFSAGGLAMSLAFVFVGGVRILYPWF